MTRVCPSVCPQGAGSVQLGGGGVRSVQLGGGQVSPAGGGSVQPGGEGDQVSQLGGGGSAKIGQQNEYSLHGRRYASCVHAGGLSSLAMFDILCTDHCWQ